MSVEVKNSQLVNVGGLGGKKARNLDPKRRLTINVEWRQLMGYPDFLYVAPVESASGEEYLELLPVQVVTKLSDDLRCVLEDDELREAKDELFESIELVYFDSQGRIRIPDSYLDYASVKDHVLLSGASDRIKLKAITEEQKKSVKIKSCSTSLRKLNDLRRTLNEKGKISF